MADTAVAVTAGSGTNIDTRTEATNGNHRQVVVLGDPSTNAGVAPVDATAGLKVDLGTDNDVTVTGTVTATLSATDNAVLDAIEVDTTSIDSKTPALGQALAAASVPVVLTAAQMTTLTPPAQGLTDAQLRATAVPISVATIPSHAVTNAGTFAVQASEADGANVTLGAKADAKSTATDTTAVSAMSVLKQISASVQAPPSQVVTATDLDIRNLTNTDVVTAELSAVDNAVLDTIDAVLDTIKTDTASIVTATQLIDDTVFADDAAVTLGTSKGNIAAGVAVATDGTDPTAVSAEGDAAVLRTDMNRLLIVNQTHPRFWHVSADYASAQTNASVKAAPGASLSLYITDIQISNGATAGNITLLDGSGGTVLYEVYPAINGGAVLSLRSPIKLTANTALCITSTTVTTHSVFVSGYIAA